MISILSSPTSHICVKISHYRLYIWRIHQLIHFICKGLICIWSVSIANNKWQTGWYFRDFWRLKLISAFCKFYGRYSDLVNNYKLLKAKFCLICFMSIIRLLMAQWFQRLINPLTWLINWDHGGLVYFSLNTRPYLIYTWGSFLSTYISDFYFLLVFYVSSFSLLF
jgi:hypothetical protein